MTLDEARDLAARITSTWPRGPGADIWTDTLTTLDPGRAGTAYIRLRTESDHAPSIARFIATYRSIHTASSDAKCEQCGGDGSITGPTFERHGHTYTSAIPCPACETGRTVARWMWPYADERAERDKRTAAHDEQLATVTNLFEDTPL